MGQKRFIKKRPLLNMFLVKPKVYNILDCDRLLTSDIEKYYNEYAAEKKLNYLRQISKDKVITLYVYYSNIINELYSQELRKDSDKSRYLSALLRGYLRASEGSLDERKLLKKLFEDMIPVLYYVEKELDINIEGLKEKEISNLEFCKFLIFLVSSLIKTFETQEIPIIPLKTCELKKYSRSRILLDEEDQYEVKKGNTLLKIKEICYFKVGSYKVLCGFFTHSNTWLSEAHLTLEQRKHILKKYDLASRSELK